MEERQERPAVVADPAHSSGAWLEDARRAGVS
jgi:hypothetical protein